MNVFIQTLFPQKHGDFILLFYSKGLNSFQLKVACCSSLLFHAIILALIMELIVISPYPLPRAFVYIDHNLLLLILMLSDHIKLFLSLDVHFFVFFLIMMKQLCEYGATVLILVVISRAEGIHVVFIIDSPRII